MRLSVVCMCMIAFMHVRVCACVCVCVCVRLRACVSLSVLSARVCVCVSACVRARVCSHNQHSTALASSCLPPSGLWLLAPPRNAPSLPALATSQHPSPRYLPWSVAVGSRRLGARALRAARATTRRALRVCVWQAKGAGGSACYPRFHRYIRLNLIIGKGAVLVFHAARRNTCLFAAVEARATWPHTAGTPARGGAGPRAMGARPAPLGRALR